MDRLVCSFTGHRPKSFPWGYNETAPDCVALKKVLAEQITMLVDDGVTGFISGMALGVDLWAAQIVLDLRKKNSALHLYCALPCEGQETKWPVHTQKQYRTILRQADKSIWVGRKYTSDCMLNCNRYMVDRASVLLAVYNGEYRSGTGMTVRDAKNKHRKIILIHPITREVSFINGELS